MYILFSLWLTQTTLFPPLTKRYLYFSFFFKLSFVYSFFLIKKNQKIKAYAAGAKNTPLSRAERTRCAQTAFRFAGFPTYFFNAPSAEANPFHGSLSASPIFHARLRHRLLPGCLLRKSASPLPNSTSPPLESTALFPLPSFIGKEKRRCPKQPEEKGTAKRIHKKKGDAAGQHEWKGTAKRIPEWIGDAGGEPRKRTRPRRSER